AAGTRLGVRWPARPAAVALALAAIVALAGLIGGDSGSGPIAAPGLRMTVLDVGQGDAILLEPADGAPILVDAGPAEAQVADELRDRGIDRLAAVVATHGQSDHIGGIGDVLARLPVRRLVVGASDRSLAAIAAGSGVAVRAVTAGDELRSGGLRLNVLWPPRALLGPAVTSRGEDPNRLSLVLLARWRGFEALLTGDAEAEATGVDPGPVDVLKVAHHGSADAGLDRLLDTAVPRLALISVGEDNPYGHPVPATVAELSEHRVPTLRTDHSGEIAIEVSGGAWTIG
ncbi:MAG: ComEC/Rec2 family competence protein, partial [Solirubrobacterales bacterium]